MKRRFLALLAALFVSLVPLSSLAAYQSSTLRHGMSGDEVREVQQALISLGYLKGTADGVFGNKTENAVRKFQKKNKLSVDGLVGSKTKSLLLSKASGTSVSSAGVTSSASSESSSGNVQSGNATSSGGSLFGNNYATIRNGNRGARVRTLQTALITLNYLNGSADGSFGRKTKAAVIAFQKKNNLTADGAAGVKTLSALEKAYEKGEKASAQSAVTAESADVTASASKQADTDSGSVNDRISAPGTGSIRLLSWYDDVKPSIGNGQKLLVYEPSSGLSWTLKVLARGRHCDAEPLTAQDTRTMIKAFGGVNTWNQKGVYVKLPDGRWSVASTHDMPHDNGTIRDNAFNGHLCVHFLRTMEEAKKNDPNYGVANQETIRKLWKSLTGQDVSD